MLLLLVSLGEDEVQQDGDLVVWCVFCKWDVANGIAFATRGSAAAPFHPS